MNSNNLISQKDKCRVCNTSNLDEIISLGNQYLVNFLDSENQHIPSAPLDLVLWNKNNGGCGLLQLKHTVSNEIGVSGLWLPSSSKLTNEQIDYVCNTINEFYNND